MRDNGCQHSAGRTLDGISKPADVRLAVRCALAWALSSWSELLRRAGSDRDVQHRRALLLRHARDLSSRSLTRRATAVFPAALRVPVLHGQRGLEDCSVASPMLPPSRSGATLF